MGWGGDVKIGVGRVIKIPKNNPNLILAFWRSGRKSEGRGALVTL